MISWNPNAHTGWHTINGRDVFGPLPAPEPEITQEMRAASALLAEARRKEKRWAPIDPWRGQ